MWESTVVIITRMQEHIRNIKESQDSMSQKLDKFIDSCETKFATKEEHLINKNEIQEIKATHSKVISWLIGTVATIFVTFLWLIIKTLWIK